MIPIFLFRNIISAFVYILTVICIHFNYEARIRYPSSQLTFLHHCEEKCLLGKGTVLVCSCITEPNGKLFTFK